MKVQIEESWRERLQGEFDKPYFEQLTAFVRQEYMQRVVYPPAKLIFNAFNLCPFHRVKVVLIGQDPYHGPGQAQGLCFSVNEGVKLGTMPLTRAAVAFFSSSTVGPLTKLMSILPKPRSSTA